MGAEERAQNLFIRYSGVLLKTASNGSFFMDITDFRDLGTIRAKSAEDVKFKSVTFKEEVALLLKDLEMSDIKTHLEYFTSFHNRYYEWEYGTHSSKWLLGLVNDTGKETNAN
jgi:leucyl aminopeptidase